MVLFLDLFYQLFDVVQTRLSVDSSLDTIAEMVTLFGDFMENINAGERVSLLSAALQKNEVIDYD